jgi:hypothetical protein
MDWFNDTGITITSLSDLVKVAREPQFGSEGPQIPLADWLLCAAFERRFSPDDARALHLAAMIVSRAG